MSKPVLRARSMSRARFVESHLHEHAPVVFDDLLAGQPITKLSSLPAALERLGPFPGRRFVESPSRLFALDPTATSVHELSVADFVDGQQTGAMALGVPGFVSLMQLVEKLPPIIDREKELQAYFANGGHRTHLHFDEHMFHNVLYQVFGRKRFILFPESSSSLLAPLGNWSRTFLEHMSEDEKLKFVDWAGGYDCVLEPGESLFIPAGMWHHVEYVDTAMSLSCRFGLSNHIRSLTELIGYYHPTVEFQHIASGMIDDDHIAEPYQRAFREIERACALDYPDRSRRFRAIQTLLERLCAEICPEKQRLIQWNGGFESQLETLVFEKGDRVDALRGELDICVDAGEIGEALAIAERFLSYRPTDDEMLASRARLRALHPGAVPSSPRRISMLDPD